MILLADIPVFILKMLLGNRPVRRWVYLGQRPEILEKVRACLSPEAQLVDYARLLDETSDQRRSSFVAWVDETTRAGRRSYEWFFSVPAVKNPANSSLFLQTCYFFVFKELMAGSTIGLVVVDSPALLRILVRNFPQVRSPLINKAVQVVDFLTAVLRATGRYIFYMVQFLRIFMTARSVFKKRAVDLLKNRKNIVLIRNYITGGFTDDSSDTVEKRYFPGLYDFLEKHDKTPVFLPIAIQTSDFRALFEKVLKSRLRIVFVEEFLQWQDYWHLALSPVRALIYRIKAPNLGGYELKDLIAEEFYRNVSEHGFLLAVLCSRLGRRLKEKGLVPDSIINWSEYQAFEKGLIAGLRDAIPSVRIIAAHPFCIPPNHLCLIPSGQEKLLNILPDRSLVLGDLGKTIVSQYLNDIPVAYTPLFRYGSILKPHEFNPNARDVLVLFGFSFTNAVYNLKMLVELSKTLQLFERVLIKLHPLANFNDRSLVDYLGQPFPENFKFIAGNLEDHLSSVAVGICGATGTAVELAVRGIPVIIAAETRALTMNYLAYRPDPGLWRICYNMEDFDQALKFFLKLRDQEPHRLKQAALLYAQAYFAPVEQKHFNNLL